MFDTERFEREDDWHQTASPLSDSSPPPPTKNEGQGVGSDKMSPPSGRFDFLLLLPLCRNDAFSKCQTN